MKSPKSAQFNATRWRGTRLCKMILDRRSLLRLLSSGIVSGWPAAALSKDDGARTLQGAAEAFSFDQLKTTAKQAASRVWSQPIPIQADALHKIDYDAYQQIKYRVDMSIALDRKGRFPIQLFHLGQLFQTPVRVFLVSRGKAREVLYEQKLFDIPEDNPARELSAHNLGFAGFRLMSPTRDRDWLSFLGASYFRSSGPFDQYGLSARAIAIDTAMPKPEEFPAFTGLWLETAAEDNTLSLYAYLDGPSVTGAYRFRCKRSTDVRKVHLVTTDVEAHIYARKDIMRLGVAPFSSMFWYGESSRKQAVDWRPEIHDSDGLSIWSGSGERLWRPINNPPRVMTSVFIDKDVRGFGLAQRDRDFVHYLDDGVFYERRPSVWVEPAGAWGDGAVHLVEIPTNDETSDNIVAYWCPKEPLRAGDQRMFKYRISWIDDPPYPRNLGRATATWTGLGGRPGFKRPDGVKKFVIDFQGSVFNGLGRNDGVDVVVTVSRGAVTNIIGYPVVDQRGRWRAMFDLEAVGTDPVDIRVFLRRGTQAMTETWVNQYFPET